MAKDPIFLRRGRPIFIRGEELLFAPGAIKWHPMPRRAVRKLAGKEWIEAAFKRRPAALRAMSITAAGRELAAESKTAADCAKPLSVGHCINLLRNLAVWPKARRK